MELKTISQVSKLFQISTRTLRYYEEIGLIQSVKKEEYSYRTFDENTIHRLQQIVVLRKLRIPLKDIARIIKSSDVAIAMDTFMKSIHEIEEEMLALDTIKNVLQNLMERLKINDAKLNLLDDDSLLEIVDSLTISKINFKEEKTMGDLNKANDKLTKLTDRDVRIVYLPPATVASYRYIGEEPEMHCSQVSNKFVLDHDLVHKYPELRNYGFNSPNPSDGPVYGYETWITIPKDMEVPSPLVKKEFEGGLYAAHTITFGAFEEWGWLHEWVENSSKYEMRNEGKGPECMWGTLEEIINFTNHVQSQNEEGNLTQLDLLYPVRLKEK